MHVVKEAAGGLERVIDMIDIPKVHRMTRLAVSEKGPGKKELKMHRYSLRTYLSLKLLGSFFAVTTACVLGAGIYMTRYYSNIITEGLAFSYNRIFLRLLIVYGVILAISLIATFVIQRKRYLRMLRNVSRYDRKLYALKKYLDGEDMQKKDVEEKEDGEVLR